MKNFMRYAKIFLGCSLIAISLDLFFVGSDIIPAGIFGLSVLYDAWTGWGLAIIVAIANILFFVLGLVALPINKVKKAVVPFILIPLLCYLAKDIGNVVNLGLVDPLLKTLYGGVLVGLGYRFIYKENHYVSGSDIIANIEKAIVGSKLNLINYCLDGAMLAVVVYFQGLESAMYSLLAIMVIETLSKRASLGTSDSKVFYIITKKDKEVREFIIDELHYTLTAFDVKGGFLKTKNTVLMSVIPTKDYYKLREGVKMIDPKAFISITDSYEVVNASKNKL